MRALADRDRGQSPHNGRCRGRSGPPDRRRERRQLGQEGVGRLAPLLPPDQPVAQHVLFGQHRDARRGETMVERQDDQSDAEALGYRRCPALPARSRRPWRPSAHDPSAGCRAVRARRLNSWRGRACGLPCAVLRHDRPPPRRYWRGRRVRARSRGAVHLEVEDGRAFGLMEGRDEMRGRGLQPFVPFLGRRYSALAGRGGSCPACGSRRVCGSRNSRRPPRTAPFAAAVTPLSRTTTARRRDGRTASTASPRTAAANAPCPPCAAPRTPPDTAGRRSRSRRRSRGSGCGSA